MPCPYLAAAPYATSGHTVYLCENPIREGAVMMPALAKLREHCLTEAHYRFCDGFQEAKNQARLPEE